MAKDRRSDRYPDGKNDGEPDAPRRELAFLVRPDASDEALDRLADRLYDMLIERSSTRRSSVSKRSKPLE